LSMRALFIPFLLCAVASLAEEKVELKLDLPKPMFVGTPKNVPQGTTVEKPTGKPRPALMVPKGVELVSRGKPVKMSDGNPVSGKPEMITDGVKEGQDGNWVELGAGLQWAQIDLQKPAEIHAIVILHYLEEPWDYRVVVVKLEDAPVFI